MVHEFNQPIQIQFDGKNSFQLHAPQSIHEGIQVNHLEMILPQSRHLTRSLVDMKQVRNQLQQLSCSFDSQQITQLTSRLLTGGGLSELSIQINGARIEINGTLSREGRRTPFWTRGFFYEQAGPHGGIIFYDIRLFGRPGLPAPALIQLLSARTGRNGPAKVQGAVTLQLDPLSLLLRWSLAVSGWKIPSYKQTRLHNIRNQQGTIHIDYQNTSQSKPPVPQIIQQDPMFNRWMALRQAEQLFIHAESQIGRGEYDEAIKSYENELWQHPGNTFVQERLMQLYIASRNNELWNKAYQIAEKLLQRDNRSLNALNCLAQYAEGIQDNQMASHFYSQMGEISRSQGDTIEAAFAFGKAAELLEGINPTKARTLWQHTRQENPAYRPAIAALARHALRNGQYQEAEGILQDLIERTSTNIERARHHLSLAGLYRSRLRNLEKAYQQLEKAAPFLHEDLAYLRELAEFRLATDENLEAIRILDSLIERVKTMQHPGLQADLTYRTGQVLEERLGQPGSALQRYRQAIQLRPEHPHSRKRIAQLEAAGIQEETFAPSSEDILTLQIHEKQKLLQNPQTPKEELAHIHLQLAELFLQQSDIEQAISYSQHALQLDSSQDATWQFLEDLCVRYQLQERIAQIHLEMAQSTLFDQEAIRHLEEALRLQSDSPQVLQQLSQRYQTSRQWDKLDTLYTRWLETTSGDPSADLWQQKAQLLEQQLQRLPEAELAYIEAYQQSNSKLPYIDGLVQYYIRHNEWAKLDRQIDRLAQSLTTEEQARLYAEKGRLLMDHPRKTREALDAYQTSLEHLPNDLENLRICVEIAQSLDENDVLLERLPQLAAVQPSDQAKTTLYQLLHLHQLQQSSDETIAQIYQQILQHNPNDLEALDQLTKHYESTKQINQATQTYTTLLESLPESDKEPRLHALSRLVSLYETIQKPNKQQNAIAQILQLAPDYGGKELAETLEFSGTTETIQQARVLFHIAKQESSSALFLRAAQYTLEEHPSTAQHCLETALQRTPFSPDIWQFRVQQTPSDRRMEVWKQLSLQFAQSTVSSEDQSQLNELFLQLQDERLLSFAEVDFLYNDLQKQGVNLKKLSQIYIEQLENEGNIDDALQIRLQLYPQLPPGPERVQVLFETAIQYLHILGQPDKGREFLWKVIQEDPRQMDAFHELQQTYLDTDDLLGFVTKLEETAQHSEPGPARGDLYIQAFGLQRDLLADENAAIALLQRAQEASAADFQTLKAIAVAYEESAAFEQAAELYKTIAEQAETPTHEKIQALERAGEIYQFELDQPDLAIDYYNELLQIAPNNPTALQQLKLIYETLWMWQELAELIKHEVEHTEDNVQQAQQLRGLADLYLGRLEDYEKALETYRWALRVNPRDLDILGALHVLYEELEDWPAAVSALKAMSRAEVDPEKTYELCLQIAALSLDRLYKIEDTEKFYKQAQTQRPERPEALRGLVDFYNATEQWEPLGQAASKLAILSQKQKHHQESREAIRNILLATERIEDAPSPKSILRNILLEQQESAALARELFDLLSELQEYDVTETAQSVPAQLYQLHLRELSWLIRVWENTEEESVSIALQENIVSAAQEQRWNDLLQQLEALTQQSQIIEETASYQLCMAEISLHHLRDFDQAIQFAQSALSLGLPPEKALAVIEQTLIQQGQLHAQKLLDIIKNKVKQDEQIRAFYHLSGLYFSQQKDFALGMQILFEAEAQNPENQGAAEAIVLLRKHIQNQTHHLPSQQQPSLPAPYGELLQAWSCFATLQNEQAIHHLDTASELDEDNLISLRTLGAYHAQSDQPDNAAFFLFRFLELEWERLPDDEITELCLTLGHIALQEDDFENVFFYTEQASKFIPEEQRLLSLQIQALERAGMWEDLQVFYENRLAYPEPTDNLAGLWFDFGQLHLNQLNNTEEAKKCYTNAIKINENHILARQALQELTQASLETT